jgi:hypothetical protein
MATIHDHIKSAERQFEGAKRHAAALREASKADRGNTALRMDLSNADADAAAIGRHLVEFKFIRDLDNWCQRLDRYEIDPDPLIVQMAPLRPLGRMRTAGSRYRFSYGCNEKVTACILRQCLRLAKSP